MEVASKSHILNAHAKFSSRRWHLVLIYFSEANAGGYCSRDPNLDAKRQVLFRSVILEWCDMQFCNTSRIF